MTKAATFAVKPGTEVQTLKRVGTRKPRIYPFHTMDVDAVIFVPDKDPDKFTTYVHKQGRQLNRKFRTQGTVMRQDPKTLEWEPCTPDAPDARRGVAITRVA